MQTSAKTKAKEFIYENRSIFNCVNDKDKRQFKRDLEKLLLEHERDTRYTAIDILNSMETEINTESLGETILQDDAVGLIHNLKVGV
ncbi:hypothetical protein KUA24_33 [Vibrio phage HNL01]|nr:hypothetical protein KUA24_33 [Vibrio phage HNL01]